MRDFPLRQIAWFLCVWSCCASVHAQARPGKLRPFPRSVLPLERDYLISADTDGSPLAAGTKINVRLSSGKQYDGLIVSDVQSGKTASTFRGISFERQAGLPSKLQVSTMSIIQEGDRQFEVLSDPASKAWVLLDQQKRDEVATGRLSKKGHSLWSKPSTEDAAAAIEEAKARFAKANELFPGSSFFLTETAYFLFYTDMPRNQVAGYIANLDAMYDQLCLMYGVPTGDNIWYGKCPVLVFQDQSMFLRFEDAVMGYVPAGPVQGLHHGFSDGKVFVTVYRGDDPAFFAAVLVHETTHGFNHRFRSNSGLPNWVEEGIADFVAGAVVTASPETGVRQREAADRVRVSRSLGGAFFQPDSPLERWQYGAASSLVSVLIQRDPNLFRAFLVAMKEGYTWEEALDLTYGLKPEELLQLYSRAIGVPGVQP